MSVKHPYLPYTCQALPEHAGSHVPSGRAAEELFFFLGPAQIWQIIRLLNK